MLVFIRALALAMVFVAGTAWSNSRQPSMQQADSVRRVVNERLLGALRSGDTTLAGHATDPHGEPVAAVHPVSPAHGASGSPAPAPRAGARVQAAEPAGDEASAGDVWASLLEGNVRFSDGKPRRRQLVVERRALVAGQHPRAIVLACSDSRCSPELLFDQSLGDLFVIRTAGEVADPVALGSIEYAVEHLHSPLLVVLGHSGCGAVTATVQGVTDPSENLRAIVEHIAPAVEMSRLHWSGDELLPHAVEANAQQSARDLLLHSGVLRDAVEAGTLRIVTAVYDLETGQVTPLP